MVGWAAGISGRQSGGVASGCCLVGWGQGSDFWARITVQCERNRLPRWIDERCSGRLLSPAWAHRVPQECWGFTQDGVDVTSLPKQRITAADFSNTKALHRQYGTRHVEI